MSLGGLLLSERRSWWGSSGEEGNFGVLGGGKTGEKRGGETAFGL